MSHEARFCSAEHASAHMFLRRQHVKRGRLSVGTHLGHAGGTTPRVGAWANKRLRNGARSLDSTQLSDHFLLHVARTHQ